MAQTQVPDNVALFIMGRYCCGEHCRFWDPHVAKRKLTQKVFVRPASADMDIHLQRFF